MEAAMNGLFGSDSILYIILIGFLVGLVARAITPGRQKLGCLLTIVLGIGGAVVATYLGQALKLYPPGYPAHFLGAVVGAVVVLLVVGLIRKV
jgi:uncharacterized membrane protein YeaQ/YmgE (transglycosylase-associated protein family)